MSNRFFALRHGHSLANQQQIVVSDPVNGVNGFGLSKLGRRQIIENVDFYRSILGENCVLISSDFMRTIETSEIVAEFLGLSFETTECLRERRFGEFELQSNENYESVWNVDEVSAEHEQWGVESVTSVSDRMWKAVVHFNNVYNDRHIAFVSHGDPIQILQTKMMGLPLSEHRRREPVQTGQLVSLPRLSVS